jgi:glycine cleavage system H protein
VTDLKFPTDLKYTKSDEWIRIEGAEGVVGVSDYAQNALSDVVFLELPEVGKSFKKEAPFGTVESVKAASDLKMPVGGTITAINQDLLDTPEKVNGDPYGAAWMIRFKPEDLAELDSLMDAAAYQAYCDERG